MTEIQKRIVDKLLKEIEEERSPDLRYHLIIAYENFLRAIKLANTL